MSDFKVGCIHVNQFRLVQVLDQDNGLTYEIYLHTLPVPGGGSDMQAIVDPIEVEGGTLWKCWLGEIDTPRVDILRREHRARRQAELPGETVYAQLTLSDHISEVVADVMDAYLKEKWVVMVEPRERKSRYQREPVI